VLFTCRHNLKDGRPSNRGHVMIGSFWVRFRYFSPIHIHTMFSLLQQHQNNENKHHHQQT